LPLKSKERTAEKEEEVGVAMAAETSLAGTRMMAIKVVVELT